MNWTRRAMLAGIGGSIGLTAGCSDLLAREGGSDDCEIDQVINEEGTFDPADTVEVTIDLLASQSLEVEVSRIGGESDPQLEIRDPQGNQLVETLPDRALSEQVTAEKAGDYLIRIDHGQDAPGEWHIVVNVLAPDC